MKYITALKTMEILACANVWMDFEDIILNEISLSKNTDIL
jgi:hypothetical protein